MQSINVLRQRICVLMHKIIATALLFFAQPVVAEPLIFRYLTLTSPRNLHQRGARTSKSMRRPNFKPYARAACLLPRSQTRLRVLELIGISPAC